MPLLLMCFVLTGCGYTPVYGVKNTRNDQAHSSLSQVALKAVREKEEEYATRTTQSVRNALLDQLGAHGPSRYGLTIDLQRSVGSQTLQQDTSITRKALTLSAEVSLSRIKTGQTIYQTNVRSIASFNTPRDPYTTLVAEQDAEQRAARILVENIITQVSVFLSRVQTP